MVMNQISVYSLDHLENFIEKHKSLENFLNNDLEILVIYNYRNINEILIIKERIHKDITSRHRVQEFLISDPKSSEEVKAYEDSYYKSNKNSKIRLKYLVLGNQYESSGRYFNHDTLNYIISKANERINNIKFNPIEKIVENMNRMFLENINIDYEEFSDDFLKDLKCVELKSFEDKLPDLDQIIFIQSDLCRSIWEAKLINVEKINYEIYYQLGLLHIDVYLPDVKNINQIVFKSIRFNSQKKFKNVFEIFIEGKIKYKSENDFYNKINFIRKKKLRSFIIDENISLNIGKFPLNLVTECDTTLENGVLKLKFPILEKKFNNL